MRKTLLPVLVLLALLLIPSNASAESPHDFVAGLGSHADGVQFAILARSEPSGENSIGIISFKVKSEPRVRANVTCLVVSGNQAFATATYIDAQNNPQTLVMHAVDNGRSNATSPDLLRFSFPGAIRPDPNRPGCFLPIYRPVPVTQGDIVVNDA